MVDEKKTEIDFEKRMDGKNINFLFGSGCCVELFGTLRLRKNISFETLLTSSDLSDSSKKVVYYLYYRKVIYKMFDSDLNSLNSIKSNYTTFINTLVNILTTQGFNKPRRANIFTTNYDLLFEYAFEEELKTNPNCFFNDGASGFINRHLNNGWYNLQVSSCGYNDNYKREIPSINLYKLHGSISWIKDNDKIKVSYDKKNKIELLSEMDSNENIEALINKLNDKTKEDIDLIKLNKTLEDIYSRNNAAIEDFLEKYLKLPLINPTKEKFKDTIFQQSYYQNLRSFSYELEKENSILFVLGFSFDDEHILDIFKRVLNNPTLEVYIICYDINAYNSLKLNKIGERSNIFYLPEFSDNNKEDTDKEGKNKDEGNFEFLNKLLKGEIK